MFATTNKTGAVVLSPSQERAEEMFLDFLQDDNLKEMLLTGPAGTGKSFMVKHLIRTAHAQAALDKMLGGGFQRLRIYYTATTNKAARVLADMTGEETSTIHSLLALKVKNDYKTGKVKLEHDHKKKRQSLHNALIILDEASMIDTNLYKHIVQAVESTTKILYIGDSYQLPPVMEKNSVVFQQVKYQAKLKEIQRQAQDSLIIQEAHKFRENLDIGVSACWPNIATDDDQIVRVSGSEFKNLLRSRFQNHPTRQDVHVLAYRNKTVTSYNKHVRGLYTNSPHFETGERVLTNNPLLGPDGSIWAQTDTVHRVEQVIPTSFENGQVPGYHVALNIPDSSFFSLPESQDQIKAILKFYAQHKEWREYFRIKDTYCDLRPIHALTCHKSQGSTYREVFIDLSDIGSNTRWWETCRMVYVALTRASERVFIYGDLAPRS